MTDTALLPRLRLAKGRLYRLKTGHPWVFSNELVSIPPLEAGSLVHIEDADGHIFGTGYFNPRTLIAFRWLKRDPEPLAENWLEERIAVAIAARRALFPGEEAAEAMRLVFGEADGLPGLVVDRYGETLCLQVLTAGMESLRPRIETALRTMLAPKVLIRKDDTQGRELEGLTRAASSDPQEPVPAEFAYLGLRLRISLLGAQKTGLFLDQRENVRAFVSLLAPGARILDVFCNAGAWGMAALKAGAASAEFVDSSEKACQSVEAALTLNSLPDSDIHMGDAFEVLAALKAQGKRFDAVVVDPPAFAKSKKHLPEALQAYRRINKLAMDLLVSGGLLATCSCSHHVGREEFREVLRDAAAKAGREARLIAFRGAASDHPVLLNFPEGDYLKCVLVRMG